MSTSILQRNNVKIIGHGNQTLILAHGFGSDQTAWKHQIAALASNYCIVLFDHVGAGASDFGTYSSRRYSSLYSYAEDLLDLCDELKLTQCVLAGHSVSGMIALLAALVEPLRFCKTQLRLYSHTLKSSSATLGATTLSHPSQELEIISRSELDKVPN